MPTTGNSADLRLPEALAAAGASALLPARAAPCAGFDALGLLFEPPPLSPNLLALPHRVDNYTVETWFRAAVR